MDTVLPSFHKKLQRPSKTSSSLSPPQDHPLCYEETQDLPLPTRPPPHYCETQPMRLLSCSSVPAHCPLYSIGSRTIQQHLPPVHLPIHSSGAMQKHLPPWPYYRPGKWGGHPGAHGSRGPRGGPTTMQMPMSMPIAISEASIL